MNLKRLQELAGLQTSDAFSFLTEEQMLDETFELPPNITLGTLERMFDVARRMMGLANKLENPTEKARHLKRIMTILNKLRAAIQRKIREYDPEAVETHT